MANDIILPKIITNNVLVVFYRWFPTLLESFLVVQFKKESFILESSQKFKYDTLVELKLPQPLEDNDFILPKLIPDKLIGIFHTWLPNLLESFLTVQIGQKGEFNPCINRKI